jgi:hypothetical protein
MRPLTQDIATQQAWETALATARPDTHAQQLPQ